MKTRGGFLLTQIKQMGSRIFEQLLKDSGIHEFNGAQGKILYVLWEYHELTIGQIAKLTSLAKTTLTSMLDRMDAKGLVKRRPNLHNRREVLVCITPQAQQLKDDYEAVSEQMNLLYYRGFTQQEIEAFEQYLVRILNNLESYESSHERK